MPSARPALLGRAPRVAHPLRWRAIRPVPGRLAGRRTRARSRTPARRLRSTSSGGLNHTGAHKITNALGQALLTRRLGKTRVIAETGAGQHGVATATACALLDLPCVVYMGAEDIRRQAPNVLRMHALGAEVREVTSGSATLKDAINDAMRDWVTNVRTTHYVLGSAVGPHPYPRMVRDLGRSSATMPQPSSAGSRHRRRTSPSPASVALERDRLLESVHRRVPTCGSSASKQPGRGSRPVIMRPPWPVAHPASRTDSRSYLPSTRTARSSKRTRSRPASTIPASGHSSRRSTSRDASRSSMPPMGRRSTPCAW